MSEPGKTYEVCWYTHDKLHFLGIDLEAFAQALKPYLQPAPAPKCGHGVEARMIYPCNECTAKLNNTDPRKYGKPGCECKEDPVEEKIEEIASGWIPDGDEVELFMARLRELVALARETK